MNRKRFLLALLVAAASTATLGAQPSDGRPRHGGPPGIRGCEHQLAQAVGLTDAQKTALDTLRKQTFDSIHPLGDQIHALHQQVETALDGSSPDKCAIGDLEIQISGVHAKIQGMVKSAEAAFVASLSSAQQASYATFIAANSGCTAIPAHPGPGGPRPPR